jgi:hypothetical protein
MNPVCPNCTYERRPSDGGAPGECPRCGVVYTKFRGRLDARELRPPPTRPEPDDAPVEADRPLLSRVAALFLEVSPSVLKAAFFGQADV